MIRNSGLLYFFILIKASILMISCEKFQYHDYQANVPDPYFSLNSKAMARISTMKKDTLTIALIGDCHSYYTATQSVVKRINSGLNTDFVIQAGDLTDFGTQREFLLMHGILADLESPYLAVAGNHDLIGNGKYIYEKMYGVLDFSITCNEVRFVFLNTNGREFDFSMDVPDLNWLGSQFSDTINYKQVVVVCHVPPSDDDFNEELNEPFIRTLKALNRPVLVLHGHHHNFAYTPPDSSGIAFLNASETQDQSYVLLKLWQDKHKIVPVR